MTSRTQWALLAGAVLLVANAFLVSDNRYAKGELARLSLEADSLRRLSARVDTLYKRDTVRLWRTVRALDTLTRTVEVWKHDTLRVVEYVARADSTVAACTAALLTCDERVRVRDARLVVEAGRYRALEATVPTRWTRWTLAKRSVRDAAIGAGILALAQAAIRP